MSKQEQEYRGPLSVYNDATQFNDPAFINNKETYSGQVRLTSMRIFQSTNPKRQTVDVFTRKKRGKEQFMAIFEVVDPDSFESSDEAACLAPSLVLFIDLEHHDGLVAPRLVESCLDHVRQLTSAEYGAIKLPADMYDVLEDMGVDPEGEAYGPYVGNIYNLTVEENGESKGVKYYKQKWELVEGKTLADVLADQAEDDEEDAAAE